MGFESDQASLAIAAQQLTELLGLCRAVTVWLVGVVYRVKYYFAWTVSEAGLILSGFCFNGWTETGKPRWDRYSNARIRHVEFSTSLAELPVHWNTCTGNFLRRCEAPFPALLLLWHVGFPDGEGLPLQHWS